MDRDFPFLPPVPEPRLDPASSPDFIIAGVPKSGSSSLAHYLRQHPRVFFSALKEPNYFRTDDRKFLFRDFKRRQPASTRQIAERTPAWYQSFFRPALPGQVRGEGSVSYFRGGRDTALRINAALPSVKILIILRQPADRAYSNYLHQRRAAAETLSFTDALAIETRRLAVPMHGFWGYREDGYYHDKLLAFYEVFGRERIKVLLHDDWSDPAAFMREIFTFIGVDPGVPIDTARRYNLGRVPLFPPVNRRLEPATSRALQKWVPASAWNYLREMLNRLRAQNLRPAPPLDPVVRRSLTEGYREDILKTQTLIGRDLSAWLA